MRILIFSVIPLPLLELLGEHLAGEGHDVINLSGKRSRGRASPGARRIIMNFDEGGQGDDPEAAWKRRLKNGAFGLKALKNLASSWRPDIILCRSGNGGAFFIRDVFPEAFLAAFAADPREAGGSAELDSKLFLESDMRFAPDEMTILKFPPLLREAIRLEPMWIDGAFFRPGLGSPFSCWKLDPAAYQTIAVVLTGLSGAGLQAWAEACVDALAKDGRKALIALTDKGGVSGRLISALGALPHGIGDRMFVTDHLEREEWRNLCASVPVVFTSKTQERHALECVACGGSAWLAGEAERMDVPSAERLPGARMHPQLPAPEFREADTRQIGAIRKLYDCGAVIPDFARRILGASGGPS